MVASPGRGQLTLVHLWGVSVGAAIGGAFVGWNSTLMSGLGGALIGLAVSTALYLCLSLCIAEMGAHTLRIGGSHTFVGESPLGCFGAYLCGVAELLKIVPTGAVCVFAIASYVAHALAGVGGQQQAWEVALWLVCYAIFTSLNLMGVEMSVNFQVSTTVLSVAVLISFFLPSLAVLDFDQYALAGLGQDGWFLGDLSTFWISLPYSLWWYLGIESVPLLAGSVQNPAKVMPKAIVISMATLAAVAILTLVLNSSVAPGVVALKNSNAPLLDGFKALTDNSTVLLLVSALVSLGLIVSFHCFVLYAGETVAVLANDGILPPWLGRMHPKYDTPHIALVGSSLIGLGLLALTVSTMTGPKAVSVLINVAVVGGLVAYILQFMAYLSRPWASTGSGFRSPLGRTGAYVGLGLCVMLLGCEFYHAHIETSEAEGMLAASLVFAVALLVYWWQPAYLAKGAMRKRTNSHEDAVIFYDEEEECRYNAGSGFSSPQRRKGFASNIKDSEVGGAINGSAPAWCDV